MPGAGIPLGMELIADKLKAQGYSTHQIGKVSDGQGYSTHQIGKASDGPGTEAIK